MRESGILYPILSLPSKFGIGCFSKEAFEFIDFLHEAGQGYWQILPIGPTGYGDSPYQSFSAFAGNPYFISPEVLINEGLLTWDECNSCDFGNNEERVDYGALYNNRFALLRKAYERFLERQLNTTDEYKAFVKKEAFWLDDYCMYMALKHKHEGADYQQWDEEYRTRKPDALKKVAVELKDTIGFFEFQQYEFQIQWEKIHEYATKKNVKIIGDIPFYVAMDSADTWSHPEAFLMDKDLKPTVVAGCAPDAFCKTGQLWGNPIYNWEARKSTEYDWWMKRFARCYDLFDVVRIDHFHGFSEYYAIPYGDETAENGKLHAGPGIDFFKILEKKFGKLNDENGMRIIAEDLGTLTPENEALLRDSGLPGMKILQYAFTSWNSIYMPHKLEHNCVIYTGTHDNIPTRAWLEDINEGEREFLTRYINTTNTDYGAIVWDIIREAFHSVADLCIIPLQDYLVFGRESRMNCPGAQGDNWQWRLRPNYLSKELAQSIKKFAQTYDRMPAEPKEDEDKKDSDK